IANGKTSSDPTPSAPTVSVSPAEAQRALAILQDPRQRAQLIETLRTIAATGGQAPAEAASSTEPKAAAPAAAPTSDAAKPQPVTLEPDSLAAQLMARLAGWPRRVVEDTAASLRTV